MFTLKDRNEAPMKPTYFKLNFCEYGNSINKFLMTATVAFLVFGTAVSTLAQPEFKGDLNSVSITDAAGTNKPPTASFTYTQNGDIFSFDAGGSSDTDGSIIEYKWDFGDGNYGTGVSVSHAYADITSATVLLTVLDNSKGVTISQNKIIIGTCQSQSADVSSLVNNPIASPAIYGQVVFGQSFTPTNTGVVYSIKVKLSYIPNPANSNIKIRVGDSYDLSSAYDTEATVNLAGYVAGDTVEVVFSTKPPIVSGVTKYFMIMNTDATFNNTYQLKRASSSTYAKGTAYTGSSSWSSVASLSYDMDFEVMICD